MGSEFPHSSLDFSKIDWSPHSFEDPGGRVFWDGGRLFRALRGRSAEAFLQMEAGELLTPACEMGLVRTWRSQLQVADYDIVVEHEVLNPGPLVSEWCPTMLLNAAMLYCDLSIFLAEHNLQLQDSHGWNIMFDGPTPKYVDFSSIIPIDPDEEWKPLDEFLHCFLYPLQMICRKQADYAFFLLGTRNWVTLSQAIPHLSKWQHKLMTILAARKYDRWAQIRNQKGPSSAMNLAKALRCELKQMRVSAKNTTRWSNYAGGFPEPTVASRSKWNEKQKSIHDLLRGVEVGSLLDIGCNTGWYSVLAARMGFDVVSMDTDRTCIEMLYARASNGDLPITPVVASPYQPIIAHGTRFYEPLEKRFVSDHTLMLALVHHLFFKQGFDVRTIVDIASKVTRKTLVIEYVPADDYWVQAWKVPHRTEEYALDVWISALEEGFTEIKILPSEYSHPSSTVQRMLLVAYR